PGVETVQFPDTSVAAWPLFRQRHTSARRRLDPYPTRSETVCVGTASRRITWKDCRMPSRPRRGTQPDPDPTRGPEDAVPDIADRTPEPAPTPETMQPDESTATVNKAGVDGAGAETSASENGAEPKAARKPRSPRK